MYGADITVASKDVQLHLFLLPVSAPAPAIYSELSPQWPGKNIKALVLKPHDTIYTQKASREAALLVSEPCKVGMWTVLVTWTVT